MKVTVLLRNDHEALRGMFDQLKKPTSARGQNGRKDLFNEIRREILIHSQMEREIFYPALTGTSSARANELISQAEQEHRSVEKLLQEMSGMNPSDKQFDARMGTLMDQVFEHIDMEEEQIFDEARKNLPEYRLEELGLEMEDRKKILSTMAA
jgi:hemerythrin superfamily protein